MTTTLQVLSTLPACMLCQPYGFDEVKSIGYPWGIKIPIDAFGE